MKKILIAVFFVFGMMSSLDAKLYEPVYMSLNSKSGIYKIGQTATVYARSERPGEELHLVVTEDGNVIVDSTIVLTEEAQPVFSQKCDRTKWVMASISAVDSRPEDYTAAGYVVAPEGFTPAYKAPEDLYQYWDDQIAKMRKKKMKVTVEKVDTPEKFAGRLKCWHVTLSMHEGRPVNGYVAVPVGAMKKALPIIITTHSAMPITSKACQSNLLAACGEAAMGCISMNMNAHGMDDGASASYYKELAKELKNYQHQPLVDKESFYFRLMYLRIIRAIDYLVKQPEWDGQRIMISGESQGGGQALAAAGIDPRVTHVRATVPAISNLGGWSRGYQSGWPYRSPRCADEVGTDLALSILPYFDSAVLVGRFTGRLFVELGFIDTTCCPNAVYAAYNNAVNAKKMIFATPWRRHGAYDARYKAFENERNKFRKPFNLEFYYKQ